MFELCSIKSLNRKTYIYIKTKLYVIYKCKVNIALFWLHIQKRTSTTMSNSMFHARKW